MASVGSILETLEAIAPMRFALDWDRVGLQVGSSTTEVKKGVVSLDSSMAAANFAASEGAQLLVAHHPLFFRPLESLTDANPQGRIGLRLASQGIAFIAAHTNWDAAPGGVNDALSSLLGLREVQPFGLAAEVEMLKLVVFAPVSEVERVIDAASAAGAGVIGNYERCVFASLGEGTFRAGPEANPTIGSVGAIESVEEARIEMVLRRDERHRVESAVRRAHSYEEPALDFYPLLPNDEQPAGRIGVLSETTRLGEFKLLVEERLNTICWAWGDPNRSVETVAVVGGAADSEWRSARASGADVLVTGEVKQHVALEAAEAGFAVLAAGHYATEQPGCRALRDRLASETTGVEWLLFEPIGGLAGRPF